MGGDTPAPPVSKASPAPAPPSPSGAVTNTRTLINQQIPRRGRQSTILTGPASTGGYGSVRTQGRTILGIPLHE